MKGKNDEVVRSLGNEKLSDRYDGVLLAHPAVNVPENSSDNMKLLKKMTAELVEAAGNQKKNWLIVGQLIRKVGETGCFAPTYKSRTAWLNAVAVQNRLNISVLWRAANAEKVLREYVARHPLEEVETARGIDMQILNQIDSIARNTTNTDKIAEKDRLIRKVIDGKMNRRDIVQAQKTVAAMRRRIKNKENEIGKEAAEALYQNKSGITAVDIVDGLKIKYGWLVRP